MFALKGISCSCVYNIGKVSVMLKSQSNSERARDYPFLPLLVLVLVDAGSLEVDCFGVS